MVLVALKFEYLPSLYVTLILPNEDLLFVSTSVGDVIYIAAAAGSKLLV